MSTAVQTLAAEISRLERSRTSSRTATKIEIRGWTVEGEESVTDKSVANIIQNFPIPNTKEDVFEFMVLASANIDPSAVGQYIHPAESSEEKSRKMLSNAWNAKLEQVYQKAKLTFGNSPDFYEIQEIYDKKKKEIKRCKRRPAIRITVILLAVLTGLFIEIWWVLNSSAKDETKHIEQLEHTVIEVQEGLFCQNVME